MPTRAEAVALLYDDTQLSPTSILGAFALLDAGRLPLTMGNLIGAAFAAYKVYDTRAFDSIAWFRENMVPGIQTTALKANELVVLGAAGWSVPARTRMDCVHALAAQLGVDELDYQRAAVTALLVNECATMTDELYARAVLCAAVLMCAPDDRAWMHGLPSDDVPRELIMRWGLRIAGALRPTSPRGTKRRRI